MVSQPRSLFVEGGGDHNQALKTECRKAFRLLLEKAGLKRPLPSIKACGSRRNAYKQFCTAIEAGDVQAVLLVDSEERVVGNDPWRHVAQRKGDGWAKPKGAGAHQLHLMVQCMEAWFLADREALATYFGKGFKDNALPSQAAGPESASKDDLLAQLERAAKDCAAGGYKKGRDSFRVLERLRPHQILQHCPWAERFFYTLEKDP